MRFGSHNGSVQADFFTYRFCRFSSGQFTVHAIQAVIRFSSDHCMLCCCSIGSVRAVLEVTQELVSSRFCTGSCGSVRASCSSSRSNGSVLFSSCSHAVQFGAVHSSCGPDKSCGSVRLGSCYIAVHAVLFMRFGLDVAVQFNFRSGGSVLAVRFCSAAS